MASHNNAPTPTAEEDSPEFDQGESDERPIPAPRAVKLSNSAAAANAPPETAAHETPETDDSSLTG
jgi:hypothetical protein